jgi:hypothetical protein
MTKQTVTTVAAGVERLPGSSWNFGGDPTGIVMVRL